VWAASKTGAAQHEGESIGYGRQWSADKLLTKNEITAVF